MNKTVVLEGEVSLLNVIDGEMGEFIKIGGGIETQPLTVTENGTYTAPYGKAYTPVTVDVEGLVPTGTKEITENGVYDVTEYAEASVDVQPPLETKTVTPTEQIQIVEPTEAYGLSRVTVEPIPNQYIVPSGSISITENGEHNVSEFASAVVDVKQWDTELAEILEGTATELRDLPVTKIKPYAFYITTRVPSGYTPVEWVGTNGINTLLDTGISNYGTVVADLEAQGNAIVSTSQLVISNGEQGNSGTWFGTAFSVGTWMMGSSSGQKSTISYLSKIRATLTMTRANTYEQSATIWGEGKTETISRIGQSTTTNVNVTLFSAAGSSPSYGANAKVFSCKLSKNGEVVANLVPCKRNSDNKYGFYDTVRAIFLTASGLVGGAEVPTVVIDTIETVDLEVTEIGEYAFYNNDLTSLTLRASQVVTLGEHAIDGTPIASGSGHIYVPSSLVSAYQADSAWSTYSSQISAIE